MSREPKCGENTCMDYYSAKQMMRDINEYKSIFSCKANTSTVPGCYCRSNYAMENLAVAVAKCIPVNQCIYRISTRSYQRNQPNSEIILSFFTISIF